MTPEVLAQYQARQGGMARWLLWIYARNRSTDTYEDVGFWNGDEDRTFTIGNVTRDYAGLSGNIDFGVVNHSIGLLVGEHTVSINGVSQQARLLIRNYDFTNADAEIHCAHFEPLSGNLIGIDRHLKGYVNEAPLSIGADRGAVTLSASFVTSVRDLTATPSMMKSDASQRLLNGDLIRRDATMTNVLDDPWFTGSR